MVMTTLPITTCDNAVRLSATGTPGGGTAPAITGQPTNQSVASGQVANFQVVATGSAPLTYQWKKNGVVIVGAPSSSTYTTPATAPADSGALFSCRVSNAYGFVDSTSATLTVTGGVVAPTFTIHPSSFSVALGSNVTFTVLATGQAPIAYQWYVAPSAVAAGSVIPGASNASLTLTNINSGQVGWYYATAINAFGSATSNRGQLSVGGTTDVIIDVPTPTNIEWFAAGVSGVSVVQTPPGVLNSYPTATAYGVLPTYTISSSFQPVYTNGVQGTIQQNPSVGLHTRLAEWVTFSGWNNPGFTAAPVLHIKPTTVIFRPRPEFGDESLISILVYYGATLKSTLKVYYQDTITGETFPQDLTYTLNTDGTYTTYALVMAALSVRVVMDIEPHGSGGATFIGFNNQPGNFNAFGT